jgi:hypothetical protein
MHGFQAGGERSSLSRAAFMLSLLLLSALLISIAGIASAVAEEPGEEPSPRTAGLLTPMSELLSGPSYLVANGLDPRIFNTPRADAVMGPAVPHSGSIASVNAQQVPFRNAAPAFSRNVILTRQLGYAPYQTEPHIAVNPLDPLHLVAGVIDYNFSGATSYVSFDGGVTWDGPKPVRFFRDDLAAGGDPVVAFDRQGNVYISQISIGIQDFRIGSLVSSTLVSSLVVAKSTDGGLTWNEPAAGATSRVITSGVIEEDERSRGEVTIPFLDKEWITTGVNPADPETDLIHMTYTEFRSRYRLIYADEVPFLTPVLTESVIKSVTSADGGQTWSDPAAVSPVVFFSEGGGSPEGEEGGESTGVEQPRAVPAEATPEQSSATNQSLQADQGTAGAESERVVQGSQPAVLSDGTLVVAYHDTTRDGFQKGLATLQVAMSTDGGQTFSDPEQATVFREIHGRPRSATFRLGGSGFPQMAIGPDDEIYLAHSRLPEDKPTDDGDIYVLRSTDRGESWDEPVRINGDDTTRPQFYPAIDVSEDGVVHAMWGDMRDDPNEVRYHIYYTRSTDNGETWGFELEEQGLQVADTRVTDFASNALRAFVQGRFIGDYFAIAANTVDVYMVWADSRLGEYGGPNQQIGFARQTAIRPPELFLNPPSGVAGRDVTIQGFGFYPDSDVIITIGGVVAATVRSNNAGEFQATIYTPVTGEGARNIAAYDPTGNVAIATFFTEFGFDSLQQSQQEVRDEIAALQAQIDALTGGTPSAEASPVSAPPSFPAASPVAAAEATLTPTPALSELPVLEETSEASGSLIGQGVSAPELPVMLALILISGFGAYLFGRRRAKA